MTSVVRCTIIICCEVLRAGKLASSWHRPLKGAGAHEHLDAPVMATGRPDWHARGVEPEERVHGTRSRCGFAEPSWREHQEEASTAQVIGR